MIASVAALLVLAVAPALIGWRSTVVVSGSMTPAIQPGDVIVARPATSDTAARTAPGAVVLVDNPAAPGELLMHRLVDYDSKGQMILKGDANPEQDSTPVPMRNLKGVASLRIPFIGLPFLWFQEGRHLLALGTVALLLALIIWPTAGYDESRPSAPAGRHRARRARRAGLSHD
ncbi:S26 family signal peptidase [Actinoplanes solisilvae]|uniref:S26 family signal peptidase n=1 Tax=Actinoplanes solisilvae TaxID=2486853 RepID=UPI0013E28707|nr:S26 family signal peptidase [Actinoplanes solisilvae]